MKLDNALVLDEKDIRFETPGIPFDSTGLYSDLYKGYHRKSGKVVVKRLRFVGKYSMQVRARNMCLRKLGT